MSELLVPISVGEFVDKISILKIKERKITDANKVANVRTELAALVEVANRSNVDLASTLAIELEDVNLKLWEIEDAIRAKEGQKSFDAEFINLARSVYHTNDKRAAIKAKINAATGSRYREEKSYHDYR